jgi:hypothetical protein
MVEATPVSNEFFRVTVTDWGHCRKTVCLVELRMVLG